jgi:formylglycine-generating enzyme required for sulfatase activity
MTRRTDAAAAAAAFFILAGLVGPARAQEPAAPAADPPAAAQQEDVPATVPQPQEPDLETLAPYSSWRTHVGPAEESLALVRMRGPGGTEFTVTGLVARCDGFLLVPYSTLERRADGDVETGASSPVLVSVGPCEGDAPRRALTAAYLYQPRAGTRHRPPFGLLKVNGPHLRSVPLLAPSLMKPGDALRVVWAEPAAGGSDATATTPGKAEAPARSRAARRSFTARLELPPPDPDAPRRSPVEWALGELTPSEGAPAAEAGELPPVGAVVVDEATGAAAGVVTGRRDGKALFASFLYLHELTNEFAAVPTREAIRDRFAAQKAELEGNNAGTDGAAPRPLTADARTSGINATLDGRMTWVPGGPVRPSGYLADRYRRYYKTDAACTPGFWVDILPVSNKEYREFAARESAGGAAFNLPWGWKESGELKVPVRWDSLPVNGLEPEEASLYAARRAKRLLTAVEFLRASKGAFGPWVQETYASWSAFENTLAEARADFDRFERLWQEFVDNGPAGHAERARRGAAAPGPADAGTAMRLAGDVQNAARIYTVTIDRLSAKAGYPWQIAQVGWRGADVSVYGVRDVVMNPPEWVQPVWGRKPYEAASKLAPSRRDPYLDTPIVTGYASGSYVRLEKGAPPEAGVLMATIRRAKHNIGVGFRCAR